MEVDNKKIKPSMELNVGSKIANNDDDESNLHIPEDIIMEILARLTVKPLNRFKVVSKTWQNLISSQDFTHLHREMSMKNKNLVGFFIHKNSVTVCKLDVKRYTKSIICMFIANPSPVSIPKYVCPISCGIICFMNNDGNICLLNPSQKQVRILPKPSIFSLIYSKLGFVYSLATNEYKVVHLFLRRYSNGSITKGMECETFTFSDQRKVDTSGWIASKEECPHRVYINNVTLDEKIYWLVRVNVPTYRMAKDALIVLFDSQTEKFKSIPKPITWPMKNYRHHVELLAVDGSLCIVDVKSMVRKSYLELWKLKEDNSWEPFYNIVLHNYRFVKQRGLLSPKYIHDGEVFFIYTTDDPEMCVTVTYNIESKTFKSVNAMAGIGVYWESLDKL